jgi:hypothetical protein
MAGHAQLREAMGKRSGGSGTWSTNRATMCVLVVLKLSASNVG